MQGVIGYSEGYVEYVDKDPDGTPTVAMPAPAQEAALEKTAPRQNSTLEERTGHTMVFVVVGMALLVTAASAALVLRKVRTS